MPSWLVSALLLLPLGEGWDEGQRSSNASNCSLARIAIALPQAFTGSGSNSQNPHPCLLPEGEGEIQGRHASFRPDFRARHHLLPARLLGFDEGSVLRRRVANGLGGVAAQALGRQRVARGFAAGLGNFVDRRLRHAGGGVQALPLRHFKTRVAALGNGRYVGQLRQALFGAGRDAAQLA